MCGKNVHGSLQNRDFFYQDLGQEKENHALAVEHGDLRLGEQI